MLDLCLFLMDNFKPVSVSGATYTKFGNRGLGEGSWGMSDREFENFDVEDFATALIRFQNGATVSLDVSWACHAGEAGPHNVQLYGTDGGGIAFPGEFYTFDHESGEHVAKTDLPQCDIYAPDRFHNFINHLLDEEPLCVLPSQALTVQKILDAIATSCQSGREVRM
jgi:predicted dehydrogenase